MTDARPAAPAWLYITAVRLAARTGQTTHVVESCRALAARRAVTLVAPEPPPRLPDGLAFVPVAVPARPPREVVFQRRLHRALPEIAARSPVGVVYIRAAGLNVGALLAARRLGAPAYLELNGLRALELGRGTPGPVRLARRAYHRLVARIEARLAAGVVAVTPELARAAAADGARRVLVAHNGVDPDHFRPADPAPARRRLGLPGDAEVVGFVGHLAPWQGLGTLVRAARDLADARPRLVLLIVGDGPERSSLERLAAPLGRRAVFTGALPHADVPAALAAADVLAAPFAPSERNRRTGLSPLKLYEYLALARPVLTSDLPGVRFVADEGLGATFAPGDPSDLARALGGLLDLPPAARAAMGARGRAAAEARFAWAAVTDRVIAFAERPG